MEYKTITPDNMARKFKKRNGILTNIIINFGITKDKPIGYHLYIFSPFSTTSNCAVIYEHGDTIVHVDEIEIDEKFIESLSCSFCDFLNSVNAKRFYYIQSIYFDTDSAFIIEDK